MSVKKEGDGEKKKSAANYFALQQKENVLK